MRILRSLGVGLCALFISAAPAIAVTQTSGSGSAVTTTTNLATFTGIGGSLLGYTEDGLSVSVNDDHCCFTGIHYGNGGNNSYVEISRTDGSDFTGIELDVGTGFSSAEHNVVWETLRDGVSTGSGIISSIMLYSGVSTAVVLGWIDLAGIDTLRIAAAPTSNGFAQFGEYQAIALDNVRVGGVSAVPLPAALPLMLFALGGLGLAARRRLPA